MKLKQVEYMERHVGDIFEGLISRIVSFGLFVHLPELLLDGLIHVRDLGDDYYYYDQSCECLIGGRQGKRYTLGDRLRVVVSRVDRNARVVDFVPVE